MEFFGFLKKRENLSSRMNEYSWETFKFLEKLWVLSKFLTGSQMTEMLSLKKN